MRGFSVIIPTLNRTSFLMNTLKDLIGQNVELPYEIIVVDQSQQEDNGAQFLAQKHPEIQYHYITHFKGCLLYTF